MDKSTIIKLLSIGENREIEFKESKSKLPKSIWETYSSFCNTRGGIIVLGVKEDTKNKIYSIEGVENVQNILKDFWNSINNKEKVSRNILTDDKIEVKKVKDKTVIIINIPRANRKDKPIYINNNPITGTYKRYNDGDFKCSEGEIKAMITEANEKSKDSVVLEEYDINSIDEETFKDYRAFFKVHKGDDHKWNFVDDIEFLYLIKAMDRKTQKLTLAGLLMFGKKAEILDMKPSFFLDYREVEEIHNPELRWKNRVTTMDDNLVGNIWDFFRKIVNKLTADIETPFALDKNLMRIDDTPVHQCVREALVNTLIHFQIDATSTTIIEKGEKYFKFSNPGDMRIPVTEAFDGGNSDPRNPILHQMFSQLGYGERAGSGLFKISKVWKEKGWKAPKIEEDINSNRTILILSTEKDADKTPINADKTPIKTEKLIIEYLKENEYITNKIVKELYNLKDTKSKTILRDLVEKKIIVSEGANRNRKYKLNKDLK